jgi:D-galactarolactone cycloisomerase
MFGEWTARRAIGIAQPDASRAGGITEVVRIAHVAQANGARVVPHISHTGLNHAATLHAMSAAATGDFFEADPTTVNPFRIGAISGGVTVENGIARLGEEPGLGVSVDEEQLAAEYPGEPGTPWPRSR